MAASSDGRRTQVRILRQRVADFKEESDEDNIVLLQNIVKAEQTTKGNSNPWDFGRRAKYQTESRD
jgi:hypothetical protein